MTKKNIIVTDTESNEIIYRGNYESFLEDNDYNENLIDAINLLFNSDKKEIYFYSFLGMEFLIECGGNEND